MWASYKRDSKIGILKHIPEYLSPEEFKDYVMELSVRHFDFAWTLIKDDQPVGVVYGKEFGDSIILGSITWFTWASNRNIIESLLYFINRMRKEVHLIGTAEMKDKKFFEHMARYGVIRRVGTFNQSNPVMTVFESRKV